MEVVCTNQLEAGVCYQPDRPANKIYVKECSSGQVCSANQMHSGNLLKLYDGTQYCVGENYTSSAKVEGESCNSNGDCASYICSNSVCKGLGTGEHCNSPDECAIGSTCSTQYSTCVPTSQEGGYCSSSSDCANNCECFIDKCIKYFSLPENTYIGDSSSLLCETGYSLEEYCAEAPSNDLSAGTQCFSSSDCRLSHSSFTSTCGCGLNEQGRAYCTTAPGDDEFKEFQAAFQKLLKINTNCHTSISISERCAELERTPELASFTEAYYIYLYRYLVIGAPSCVISTIAPFASNYDVKDEGSSSSDTDSKSYITVVTLSVVIPVMIIAGVVFYIVIRKLKPREVHPQTAALAASRRIEIYHSRIIQQEEGIQAQEHYCIDDLQASRKNKKGIPMATGLDPESRQPEDTFSDVDDGKVESDDPVKGVNSEVLFERL